MSQLVVASTDADFEQRVREALAGDARSVEMHPWGDGPVGPVRVLDAMTGQSASVVAVGPDIPAETALELTRALDRSRPDISVVIVAEPSASLLQSALRAGARDVVAPDASTETLRQALDLAFEAATSRRNQLDADAVAAAEDGVAKPRVMLSLCPKGGAGKTTLSTNIALGLAQLLPGEVVIVDLDLQFGDVASALSLEPEHSFADTVRIADTIDATSLKAYLTAHSSGLFALCAPSLPTEADFLSVEHVGRVIELLTQSFTFVVIDTPSGLDEATLAALEYATDLMLLSATDVPSIRSTRKEIDALRIIGKPSQQWHFVLNRADAKTGLTIPAIERVVGLKVDVAIPSSRGVPISLNQGMPILESDPRSPVSLAMAQIVSRLVPDRRPPTDESHPNGNGHTKVFSRTKKSRPK
jgi:pilus assembly protein CpaE